MSARSDYREFAREDERRKREEAKVLALQTQIDELRNLTRELGSRQVRLEDLLKSSEANLAQHRQMLEQHRHEVSQSAQARQLEEARVRQQLTDLSARIDDSTRPIRSLQAHVAELLEAVRRQRDDVSQDTRRFDELKALIDHIGAHGERQVAVSQALRDSIETVRVEVEQVQRDQLRTDDGIKIVDQESRRRFAEVAQQIENVAARLEAEFGGVDALQTQIDDLRQSLTLIDPQFEAIREVQEHTDAEIVRFHAQAVERDDLASERLDEIRQQFDVQIRDIIQNFEQRIERVLARMEQLDERDREAAYRISMIEMHLEQLEQIDVRIRREMWYLNEQRARLQVEQAQNELEAVIDARREVEQATERTARAPRE
jgi:chromosome segregation ATPase